MIFLVNLPRFLLRHFPIFIAGIMLSLCSVACSVSLAALVYFSSDKGAYAFFGSLSFASVIIISNLMIIYGRPQWVWGMVGVFVFCLLILLSPTTYGFNPHLWSLSILFSLLGLLVLNSKRHRRMRRKMVQVRHYRVMVRRALVLAQDREQSAREKAS